MSGVVHISSGSSSHIPGFIWIGSRLSPSQSISVNFALTLYRPALLTLRSDGVKAVGSVEHSSSWEVKKCPSFTESEI
jgi:hypothetical protein